MNHDDEIYRERWLSCFLASYAMFGVLSGACASIGAAIRKTENAAMVGVVCAISLIQLVAILWMFYVLRRTYDFLGFSPDFKDGGSKNKYEREGQSMALRGKKIRKFIEKALHVSLVIQVAILWLAWG